MNTSDAALLMTVRQAKALRGLADWPPVGGLMQSRVEAANGEGAFSAADCRRVSAWARRWEQVPAVLRIFYESTAGELCVSPILWHIMEDYDRPEGAAYGRVVRLWEDHYGVRPPFSLIP